MAAYSTKWRYNSCCYLVYLVLSNPYLLTGFHYLFAGFLTCSCRVLELKPNLGCRGVLSLLFFISVLFHFLFYFLHFPSMQEPTLLYYRQKGVIPTAVVGRNPCYRTGDHTRSIPQDPWFSFLKFQVLFQFVP